MYTYSIFYCAVNECRKIRSEEVVLEKRKRGYVSPSSCSHDARNASNSKTKIKVSLRAGWKWKSGRKVDKQKAIHPGANKY